MSHAQPPSEDRPRPDIEEVQQSDYPPVPAVAVDVQGIVYTQEVPATRSVSRNIRITNDPTTAQEFPPDPRRKALTIWVEANGIYFCEDRQGVLGGSPTGAHLPAGGSYTIQHQNAVWILGDNAAISTLSYVMEQWAD